MYAGGSELRLFGGRCAHAYIGGGEYGYGMFFEVGVVVGVMVDMQ